MIVFAARGQSIGLGSEPLVDGRTCLLEREWLKVTSRDWLAIVPTDF